MGAPSLRMDIARLHGLIDAGRTMSPEGMKERAEDRAALKRIEAFVSERTYNSEEGKWILQKARTMIHLHAPTGQVFSTTAKHGGDAYALKVASALNSITV